MKSPQTPKNENKKNDKSKKKNPAKTPMPVTEKSPKPEKIKPAAYDNDATDAFIKEVDEEVHNDELKVFWNKYGLFVILFVVLAVSAAVGFETIKNWRDQQHQQQTEKYLSAVQGTGNTETTLKVLENIAAEKNGLYSELAKIQIADILAGQNKMDEALPMLQTIAADQNAPAKIKNLAALKLATYKIGTAPREEIEALLNPIVAENSAWSPSAQDLLAMTAIADGDMETAREIYLNLIQNPEISPNFKSRIQDMLSSLNDM